MKWITSGIEILRSWRSLAVVAGMKKTNDHAEPSNAIFFNKKMYFVPKYSILVSHRSINVTWLSWDL